jgi:hypothetical protein
VPDSNAFDRALVDITEIDDAVITRVVRHLNRTTRAGREKAAKDPVTKMYLQAGLRLLAQEFRARSESDQQDPVAPPFFSWVSRAKVVDETAHEPLSSGLPRRGNISGIRDRWEPHRDYIADLLLVALASEHWSSSIAEDQRASSLFLEDDLAGAIHRVAFLDIRAITTSVVAFQVQIIATSFAEHDTLIRAALKELYRVITDRWAEIYTSVLVSRGLSLRTGVTINDVTNILTATAEGFALRLLADPSSPVWDRDNETTLLGTAALSLVIGCVDFTQDGMTVEEFLAATLESNPG